MAALSTDSCRYLLQTPLFLEYHESLVGLPVYLVRRLQSVLNAAARLIYHMTSADHITDALVSLHWLRVPQRIEYKIAVLTYKALIHGSAPRYLGPLVPVADLPGRRALHNIACFVLCRQDLHRTETRLHQFYICSWTYIAVCIMNMVSFSFY